MYGLGGMWIFSLILVFPLLIGVASASKRLYSFLIDRGTSKNNALTTTFVALVILAGLMTSPLFLAYLPVRLIAGVSYLYFLFHGAKSIIGFFTGASGEKSEQPAPHHHDGDGDCGCDHEHGDHHGKQGGDQPAPRADEHPAPRADERPAPRPQPEPEAPRRSGREELERRLSEGGDGDKK